MKILNIFLDFEASSLGRNGFPIEVGWAAADGSEEGYLIRPAPGWEEWADSAERVHGIPLERLLREGTSHAVVARRMLQALEGHVLYASAPSWDGQWLSKLLRAAGLPRHALRLRDTEEALRSSAAAILEAAGVPVGSRRDIVEDILGAASLAKRGEVPAHRALNDARRELQLWQDVCRRAEVTAARWPVRE